MMKKIFALILFMTAVHVMLAVRPYCPKPEKLTYKVMYKWGIIHKQAGTVTINSHNFANGFFESILVGRSASWADRFYAVRDTLKGKINAATLEPVYYENIAHEGGDYKRDVILYDRSTQEIIGDCRRWRKKKDAEEISHSTIEIKATGVTLDMLSSFYYMRHIAYEKMKPNQSKTMTVFSGRKKETLKITYLGNKSVEVEGRRYPCFYIKFTFTGDNGKKSSDDMFAWISIDSRRIPVMLLGNLPIGSIRCYYTPD